MMAGLLIYVSIFVSSFVLTNIFGYKVWKCFTPEASMLFGVIISLTDSVPVYALFKDLGVSKNVITMLEGESLLNNGTAIIAFQILIDTVEGHIGDLKTTGETVLIIFQLLIGGILLGLVSAFIISLILRRIHN